MQRKISIFKVYIDPDDLSMCFHVPPYSSVLEHVARSRQRQSVVGASFLVRGWDVKSDFLHLEFSFSSKSSVLSEEV